MCRSSSSVTLAVRSSLSPSPPQRNKLILIVYQIDLYFQLSSHAYLFEAEQEQEEEQAKMNVTAAVISLVAVTVVTSFCADYRTVSPFSVALQF
jgi:Ca2+/H+ antiporter